DEWANPPQLVLQQIGNVSVAGNSTTMSKWPVVPPFAWPFHGFKKEALIANETTCLSNERRNRLALGISCDHLAIMAITLVVRKREHRHSNIRTAIIAKSRKTHPHSVWGRAGNEISMMSTTITFDEHDPSARITLKRTRLAQVERVPNLTCY